MPVHSAQSLRDYHKGYAAGDCLQPYTGLCSNFVSPFRAQIVNKEAKAISRDRSMAPIALP